MLFHINILWSLADSRYFLPLPTIYTTNNLKMVSLGPLFETLGNLEMFLPEMYPGPTIQLTHELDAFAYFYQNKW